MTVAEQYENDDVRQFKQEQQLRKSFHRCARRDCTIHPRPKRSESDTSANARPDDPAPVTYWPEGTR